MTTTMRKCYHITWLNTDTNTYADCDCQCYVVWRKSRTNPVYNIQYCYTRLPSAAGLFVFVVLQQYGIMVWMEEEDAQLSLQTSQTPYLLMYVKHPLSDGIFLCDPSYWQKCTSPKFRHFSESLSYSSGLLLSFVNSQHWYYSDNITQIVDFQKVKQLCVDHHYDESTRAFRVALKWKHHPN